MTLANQNIEILKNLRTLIIGLNREQYETKNPHITHRSIGSMVHEIVQYHQNLITGIYHNYIQYDAKNIDLSTFNNMDIAAKALDNIMLALQSISEDKKLAISGLNREKNNEMSSTLTRELAFNYDHTLQLISIIRLSLGNERRAAMA